MCEIALLCRLACGRFVASSRHAAHIDVGEGVKVAIEFLHGKTKLTVAVVSPTKQQTHETVRVIEHDKLLKVVSPRGNDGGVIFTAALARAVVDAAAKCCILVEREPGVAGSLPQVVDAREMAAAAAAFCKLRMHSFSVQMRTALLQQCVSIKFNRTNIVVSTGAAMRKVHLPTGAQFVTRGHAIVTDATDRPNFNADIVLANLCSTLFVMV